MPVIKLKELESNTTTLFELAIKFEPSLNINKLFTLLICNLTENRFISNKQVIIRLHKNNWLKALSL